MASAAATAETKMDDSAIKSRAYQMEMLEESLKGNVIVTVCFSLRSSLLLRLIILDSDGYWQR